MNEKIKDRQDIPGEYEGRIRIWFARELGGGICRGVTICLEKRGQLCYTKVGVGSGYS